MDEVFTISQIKERWEAYLSAKGWRVLKEGKWKLQFKSPDLTGGATKAEMVKIKDYMSFPKYLEDIK